MSILIKGMEMPPSCSACSFMINCDYCEGYRCFCAVLQKCIGYLSEVPTGFRIGDCPLVPVPPHGRLIDADAARKTIKPWSPEDERTGCTFDTVKKVMNTMLTRAPTIIPAEEGE